MKKLFFLFLLPVLVFSQEDIERYKIYPTENMYTSLKLDTATGRIWQLQIGLGDDVDRVQSVLSDIQLADFKEDLIRQQKTRIEKWIYENPNATPEEIENNAPMSAEKYIEGTVFAQNGRFKLYPTQNMYNFIMQDVITGQSYQVQWSTNENERLLRFFW